MKIGVIGAGRWAGTLANLLLWNGHEVVIFCLTEDLTRIKNNRQILHTKDYYLDERAVLTAEPLLLPSCEAVFVAVDGKNLEACWKQWGSSVTGVLAIAVKTLNVIDNKLVLPTDIVDHDNTVYFASGAFPEGLLAGSPAIGTLYGPEQSTKTLKEVFPQKYLRIYTSTDIVGGQIVSALKNVIAIACGIAMGIGLDEMTRAAIVSRGVYEMRRFGTVYGAKAETFGDGSSGLADAIGTCFSNFSHNLQVGKLLAEGKFDQSAIENKIGTAEGILTVHKLMLLPGALGMMPIAAAVAKVAFMGVNPEVAMQELMARPLA